MTQDQGVLIIVESKRRRDDEPTERTNDDAADDTIRTVTDPGRDLEDEPGAA